MVRSRARYIRELIQREIKQTMKITSVFGPTHQLILRRSGAAEIRRRINLLLIKKKYSSDFCSVLQKKMLNV